jgi:cytochrome P450
MPTDPTEPVTSATEVRAILADPAYVVPPARPVPPTETGTLAWLRAHVARFCEGEVHDQRRELVEGELAALDPAKLRATALELTSNELTDLDDGGSTDAMTLAKRIPVAVLAAELGLAPDTLPTVVDAVLASASGYPNPDAAGPNADAGVQLLASAFESAGSGPADDELVANRIGLLEQACDATAGLIGNALIAAFAQAEEASTDEILASVVTDDPPVRRTRRVAPDGALITLDITSCTFGGGRRPCPGADQALALAAGVLDAILPSCELADQPISYLPSANLRLPAQVMITRKGGG